MGCTSSSQSSTPKHTPARKKTLDSVSLSGSDVTTPPPAPESRRVSVSAAELHETHAMPEISQAVEQPEAKVKKCPEFVPIDGTNGSLSLWHYPSRSQLLAATKLGCTHVVTLQSIEEGAEKVHKMCDNLGIAWKNIDFWPMYLNKDKHDLLASRIEEIATLVRHGANVLIHCAAGIHRTGMAAYLVLRMLGHSQGTAHNMLLNLREVTYRRVGEDRIQGAENALSDWLPNPERSA